MILPLAMVARAEEVHRYALLVGTNDGGPDRVPLRYAHSDAQALADLLVDIGGVEAERQRVLLDPDVAVLEAAFERLRTEIAADAARSEVVFYYSGHSDEEGLLLGTERFEYRDLRASLDGLPARVRVAILDSCASGALILSKGGRKIAPFLVDESVSVDGFAYITSSSADEVAQEAERVGGSYFTHFLETGLRGAADLSHDGRVTLTEAYSFAYDETLARTERTQHGPQHPTYQIELSGTGDLVLTDLSLTPSALVLDEGLAGRALVRDDRDELVAELAKPAGRRVEIALAAGSYTVVLVPEEGEEVGRAEVELAPGQDLVVAAEAIAWSDTEPTVGRGGGAEERTRTHLAVLDTAPSEGTDALALALLTGHSTAVEGAAIGALSYAVDQRARSLVAAFGYTQVGELAGVQAAMGANLAKDGGDGVQFALGANATSGGFDGLQFALGYNQSTRGFVGAQLGAGLNVAGGGVRGAQVGAVNVSGAFSRGAQLAVLNVSTGDLEGLQLGLVNAARDVPGLQLALVNTARRAGTQIGLVNVAKESAVPIGLLSIVEDGRHDLLVYPSESDWLNGELRFGGRYFYNVLGAGGIPGEQAYASYGLGVHAPMVADRVWLDLDAVMATYIDERRGWVDAPPTGVVRPRATVGVQTRHVGAFAGVVANVRLPIEDLPLVAVAPRWLTPDEGTLVFWPGFYGGVALRI